MHDKSYDSSRQYSSKVSINLSPVNDKPDSKVHGANMGPTWVLSVPDGPNIGPMNLAFREDMSITIGAAVECSEISAIPIDLCHKKGKMFQWSIYLGCYND